MGAILDGFDEFIPKENAAIGATKGAAALGGLTWASFVFTLIVFSTFAFFIHDSLSSFRSFELQLVLADVISPGVFLHKHRVANGATGIGMSSARAADVEKGAGQPVVTENPVELQPVAGHSEIHSA